MKKLSYLIVFLFMSIGMAIAQTKTASGTVISSEDGLPVIGATVTVKGNETVGTITDNDGKFTLANIPSSATKIIISFIGLQTQELDIERDINVTMSPDEETLDEVVVVAYGTAKKSSFSGAATQIKGEKIQKTQVSNVSKALDGAVAGVQTTSSSGTPGSGASIIVRGINSISASRNPLIVVDGVPYEGSLNSIASQDIESLTVLKDAAANSMYGARGSNGVIIITTKSGKSGKVKINFDGRVGYNGRAVPNYDIISDAGEYYEMSYESIRNSLMKKLSYMDASAYTSQHLIDEYLKYNIYKGVSDNSIIDPMTGKLTSSARQASRKWNDNWQEDPFQNGLRQEYNVNVNGGSETTTAYTSLGYLSDEGYMTNSKFDRISARANVTQKIGKQVKIGANISYANTNMKMFSDRTESNYSNIFMFSEMIAPIYPIYMYDNDGNPILDASGVHRYDFGDETGRPYGPKANPVAVAKDGITDSKIDNFSGHGYFEAKFLKDFKFTANLSYSVFNTNSTLFMTPNGGDAADVGGRGERGFERVATMNANQLLNYSPKIGRHSLDILIGHESDKNNYSTMAGEMTNFVDPSNPEFSNASLYQDLNSYSYSTSIEGFFTRAEYNYDEKYYATASIRRDGSSRFHPDNRWGTFWAVGASWRMEKENFMRDLDFINSLKLKASFGTQGNENLPLITAYKDLYSINRVNGEAGMTKVLRGNPDLTWEKSANFNAGFESRLWDKLNVNMDFFIRKTTDMLYASPLPLSEGIPTSIYRNEMDMKNTGIEIEINYDIINTNDFKWSIGINATHYKNELTKLPASKPASLYPNGYQAGSYWRKIGGSLYDWYTYEYAGVNSENGLPLYNKYTTNKDNTETVTTVNKTSDATLRETGKSAIPDWTGGISTTIDAYGFDLSIQTSYQIGGYAWDSFYQSLMNVGNGGTNFHKDMFNRWTETNRNTDIPRLDYSSQEANGSANRWLTSASYFNLKNITLGYSLPSSIIKKLQVEKLRVYLVGDNIALFSKRKGFDPRQNFSGETGYVYAPLSTFSVGVNLSF